MATENGVVHDAEAPAAPAAPAPDRADVNMTNELALELRNISFRYASGTEALEGVDFSVRRGELVGIVGPSGCGKSTLLQIVSGFAQPSTGQAVRPVRTAGRHPMAMVFQKDTVLPWLTVAKNIGLASHLARDRRNATANANMVTRLIEMGGLTDFRDAYPYQLSGGMRRRVAFLTSVAAHPQLLLLDEPFSALDEPTKIGIHQSIREIMRELAISGILVTHDIQEAITLCDEVIVLTRRPGSVASRHRIPFEPDRVMLELRERPEFLTLYGTLWHELSRQIRSSDDSAVDAGEGKP